MRRKSLSVLLVFTLLVALFSTNTVVYGETKHLINTNFENGADGFEGKDGGKGELSTDVAHSGTTSFKVSDRKEFWEGAKIDITGSFKAGVEYTTSMWVYHDETDPKPVKLSVEFINATKTDWKQFAEAEIPSKEWTEITGTLTVESDTEITAAIAYLETAEDDFGFAFYVDDIVVSYDDTAVPEDNDDGAVDPIGNVGYIENAGFEVDNEGWVGKGATAAVSTDQASEGIMSLSITDRTDGWQGAQKDFLSSFELDTEYTISFMVYHTSGSDENIKMTLENTVGGVKGYDTVADAMIPTDTWTEVTSTFTKANTGDLTEAILYFEAVTIDLSFYIDQVQVSYELPAWNGMTTSFETGLDGFTPNVGSEIVSVSTEQKRTGLQSAKVEGRLNNYEGTKFEYSDFAESGKEYEYSLWVYQDSGVDKSITLTAKKELVSTEYINLKGVSVPSGEWTEIRESYSLEYSGELKHFSIYLEAADPVLEFYVDDVSINIKDATVIVIEDLPSMAERFAGDFTVGVAIPSGTLSSDAETELIKKHFSSITAENDMKPTFILDADNRGQVNNLNNDVYFNYASDNGLVLRGHTLLWHQETPDWFFNEGFADDGALVSREVMLERLDKYIGDIVGNYDSDILYAWDVVNEAIDTGEPDNMRNSLWRQIVGPDYVEKAFEYARKHTEGMDVKLFYNDYNVNDSSKRAAILELVTDLYEKGLVDGMGIQSHLALNAPSANRIEETIQMFGEIGLEIQITELDIDVYSGGNEDYVEAPEDLMVKQGYRYKELFEMFKANSDVITNVTFWGLTDNRSWLNYFPVDRNNWPLIFDKDLQAKYAYYGIMDPDSLPVFSQEINAYKGSAVIDSEEDFDFSILNSVVLEASETTPEVSLKTLWDETTLYAELTIMDNTEDVSDLITVMVDVDQSKSDNLEVEDVLVSVGRDGLAMQNESLNQIEDIMANTSSIEGGYRVEVSIPMANLTAGDKLGFDFAVNDGMNSIKWNDQYDNTSVSPKRFGTLILSNALKNTEALVGSAIIDGVEDDIWANANEINVNNFSQNTDGSTALVKTLWDTDFLYIYAVVDDALLAKESGNVWEQDSVEIFIDENNNRTSSYEMDDVQYRVNYDNETSNSGGPSESAFESATRVTDNGYIVEAKVPFNLDMETAGMVLGFDIQVNNDDGSGVRTSIANWNDLSGNGWRTTQYFGVLVLSDEEALEEEDSNSGSGSSNNSTSSNNSNSNIDLEEEETPLIIRIPFTDVLDTHWAATAISVLASKGIISGNGDGEFLPNDEVTRAEYTKLVVLALDLVDEDAIEDFDDVDSEDWFYDFVSSGYSAGIIKGYNGNFMPNDLVSRQDMAAILYRGLQAKYAFEETSDISLTDLEDVSEYALEAVTKLHKAGVINGDDNNLFNPNEFCLRAEAAQIIYNAMELIED